MNPEKFHDAMNYLDDDLIAQTDDLRQGRAKPRRFTARKIIAWVAPAACLALVLGIGPRFLPAWDGSGTAGAALNGNMEAGNPAELMKDEIIYGGAEVSIQKSKSDYILEGVSCGDIYIEIPQTWSHEIVKEDGGGYFLHIRPPYKTGYVRVGYWPNFGVCGTGLQEMTDTIAGRTANLGYYDGGKIWSFITFGDDYVVINEGMDGWSEEHREIFMKCLETLVFGGEE